MKRQPKKNITKVNKSQKIYGNMVRKNYQKTILEKAPVFPKPLEYDDIDNAVFNFVDKQIDIVVDGALIPTYTLYSNQRFSEYTQMWEHSDEFGNLYLNFKTVNRDKNPSFGKNQGELWNIPGQRKYTLLQREVLEDNGTESYEIYTMKQPYAVDLSYTINFVTTTVDYLNQFNQKINKLFSARQYYIRPNGHFIPMVIDEISDETAYSISDRKFYVQSVTINLMAYIIENNDFEVKKYPKRTNLSLNGNQYQKNKPCVEIEEIDNPIKNKTLNVNIKFPTYHNKIEFEFDTDMNVEKVYTENVRSISIMVNDILYYIDKTFKIHNDDNIEIKIIPVDYEKESKIYLLGINENEVYNKEIVPEKVYEDITHENIIIE